MESDCRYVKKALTKYPSNEAFRESRHDSSEFEDVDLKDASSVLSTIEECDSFETNVKNVVILETKKYVTQSYESSCHELC